MARLVTCVSTLCAASTFAFMAGCLDSATDEPEHNAVAQASSGHTEIHTEDRCDPVTFGALCNPATHGTTTFDNFLAQFNANHSVVGWEYGGGDIRVSSGQSFRVDNRGGETHTFTVVAQFGGGRVDFLNAGNPTVAPECIAGPSASNVDIASLGGITVTTGANGTIKTRGTVKVQCCIHPWMRTTVSVQ
jgi:hypothetical protein